MRVRVTYRFYLFLLAVVLLAALLSRISCDSYSETVAMSGVASDTHKVNCVIVRDEIPVSDTQITYYEFVSREGTLVREGETVCHIYKNGNITKLLNDLNTTRRNIQQYHKLLLGNELDSQLTQLDLNVQDKSKSLRSLITGAESGSMWRAVSELEAAMTARRAYISSNKRNDTKLMKLYSDESSRETAILGNRAVKTSPRDGVVSFYLDGYETSLNADTVADMSISDINTVLSGGSLGEEAPRSSRALFRVIDQQHWWIALLSREDDEEWNPILGTEYEFRVTGYEDLVYRGEVVNVVKNGTRTLAILEIRMPIDMLLYLRTGSATIGANMSGLLVEKAAVTTESGQTGVWKRQNGGDTFVPVQVLTKRSDGTWLVKPVEDGTLAVGDRLLIK